MDIHENLLLAVQTPLTQLGAPDFLTDLPKAMYVMVMIVVLFLPLLMIPYIFVKMGSVAGKVQASLNSAGRSLRKGVTRAAMKEGKGFARDRGMEWAARRAKDKPTTTSGKLANFALNRDRVREGRRGSVKKALEDAHYEKVASTPGYARKVAGIGDPKRIQTIAESHLEQEYRNEVKMERERHKRTGVANSTDGLLSYIDSGTGSRAAVQAATELAMETGGGYGKHAIAERLRSSQTMSQGGAEGIAQAARENGELYLMHPDLIQEVQDNKTYVEQVASAAGNPAVPDTATASTLVEANRTRQKGSTQAFWQDYATKPEKVLKLNKEYAVEIEAHMSVSDATAAMKSPSFASADAPIRKAIENVVARQGSPAAPASSPAPQAPTAPSPSQAPSSAPAQPPQRKPIPPGASGGFQGDHTGPNDLWIPRDKP